MGDTGVGKSTFIKFLLDSGSDLLSLSPSGASVTSVTKFPVQISFGEEKVVKVHFLKKEWLEAHLEEGPSKGEEAEQAEEQPLVHPPNEEELRVWLREKGISEQERSLILGGDFQDLVLEIKAIPGDPGRQVTLLQELFSQFGQEAVLFIEMSDSFEILRGDPLISIWDTPGLNQSSPLEMKKTRWALERADVLLPIVPMRTTLIHRYLRAMLPRLAASDETYPPQLFFIISSPSVFNQSLENPWEMVEEESQRYVSGKDHFRQKLRYLQDLETEDFPSFNRKKRAELREVLEASLSFLSFSNLQDASTKLPSNMRAKEEFFIQLRTCLEVRNGWRFQKALLPAQKCLSDLEYLSTQKIPRLLSKDLEEAKTLFGALYFPPPQDLHGFFRSLDRGDPADQFSLANIEETPPLKLFARTRLNERIRVNLAAHSSSAISSFAALHLVRKSCVCLMILEALYLGKPLEKNLQQVLTTYGDLARALLDQNEEKVARKTSNDQVRRMMEWFTEIIKKETELAADVISQVFKKSIKSIRKAEFPLEESDSAESLWRLIMQKVNADQRFVENRRFIFGGVHHFKGLVEKTLFDEISQVKSHKVDPSLISKRLSISQDLLRAIESRITQRKEPEDILILRENMKESLATLFRNPLLYSREIDAQLRILEKKRKDGSLEAVRNLQYQIDSFNQKKSHAPSFPKRPVVLQKNCEYTFLPKGTACQTQKVPVFYNTHGKEKVISVEFAGKSSFVVNLYEKALSDLVQNLQSIEISKEKGDIPSIYPIFIPSKGHHGLSDKGKVNFLAHLPIAPEESFKPPPGASMITCSVSNQMQGSSLVFLVVEEQEFQKYRKVFASYHSSQLIFVSIPGHREADFAREMIKMVQLLLKNLIEKEGCFFDLFFMIEDDLEQILVYDEENNKMQPSSLEMALSFCQETFRKEFFLADDRQKLLFLLTDDENHEEANLLSPDIFSFIHELPFAPFFKNHLESEKNRTALIAASSTGSNLHALLHPLFKNSKKYSPNLDEQILEWVERFQRKLEEVRISSTLNLALISLSPAEKLGDSGNYNFKLPRASHRIASLHSGVILMHSPALEGFGFLPAKETNGPSLFSQPESASQERSKTRDHSFHRLLEQNGRGGYQVYLFSAAPKSK